MKKIILIYIFLFGLSIGLAEEHKKTNYSIFTNLSLNGVIYQSDFNELPGYKSCCTNFSSAFGIQPGFLIGVEYKLEVFGNDAKYGFGIGMQNLSADYINESLSGYDIVGNDKTEIISEYRLNPSIQNLITRHHLALDVLDFIDSDFLIGFKVGFPVNMSFEQEEYMKSPNDLVFETGSRYRDVHSADIPDKSSLYFAVDVGIRHSGFKLSAFNIEPELTYSHSFTDFSSSVDWKGHNIALGINIVYNVPKAKLIPPIPAPNPKLCLPEIPPKPEPGKLELALNVFHEGKDINDKGKLNYKVYVNKEVFKIPVLPILYFDRGSKEPIKLPNKLKEMFGFNTSSSIISQLAEIMKKNNASVKLRPTVYGRDESTVADARINSITKYLAQQGIKKDKITILPLKVINEEMKYRELENESRRVDIILESSGFSITSSSEELTKTIIPLRITSDVVAEAKPYVHNLRIIENGNVVKQTQEESLSFNISLDRTNPSNNKYEIYAHIVDAENKETAQSVKFEFNIEFEERATINKLTDQDQSMHLLGYFAFDSNVFTMTNDDAVDIIKNALQNGSEIELIPLTDELGTNEYNSALAKRRANAAVRLLKLDSKEVNINYDIRHLFPNDNPYGRIMNRAVWVKIK